MEILYKNKKYQSTDKETVLDCLLRHEIEIPNACRAGVCQSCLLYAEKGTIPEEAQKGLKATLKQQHVFMACQCIPVDPMSLNDLDNIGLSIKAEVLGKRHLTPSVIELKLKPHQQFDAHPGQYLTLITSQNIARSYSIANNPSKEGYIILHIGLVQKGEMSNWVTQTHQGEVVTLYGPAGTCFYSNADDQKMTPIILAGTGTGLAPLFGIINDALEKGHQGPIELYHGAKDESGLYLKNELKTLTEKYKNFRYTPCIAPKQNIDTPKEQNTQSLQEIVLTHLPENKNNLQLFICGAPEMVNNLKMQAFMKGVGSKNIFADPFIPRPKP